MQPRQQYNITQYEELGSCSLLRSKMIRILRILTTSTYIFLFKRLGECIFLSLGEKGLNNTYWVLIVPSLPPSCRVPLLASCSECCSVFLFWHSGWVVRGDLDTATVTEPQWQAVITSSHLLHFCFSASSVHNLLANCRFHLTYSNIDQNCWQLQHQKHW